MDVVFGLFVMILEFLVLSFDFGFVLLVSIDDILMGSICVVEVII